MNKNKNLKLLAAKIRLDILEMLMHRGYGHLGGSMSVCELFAVLYGKHLNVDPKNPGKEDRDMVVLSKGHAGPAWYSALAEMGYFPKEVLLTLNDGGTILPSHPDRNLTPGVDATTGSLGQGTSIAAGIATGQKYKGKNAYTYMIVGDGELNEGQCWEAFMYIAQNKLNNCIVIIDDNKRQLDGYTKDIMNPFDLKVKMESFGFKTLRVDGGDVDAIDEAITELKKVKDQAVCIVLDTIKGQGIKYFEDLFSNHSVKFNNDEINAASEKAVKELKAFIAKEEAK
ncbi:MAG TPA: transketolase [Erysipelotrichaceae bacterium]|nr:transketolase [Erysipelotrichaceae bacterium]HQB31938.1 transketolase [Erysipelotrichaceae bacterium]